MDEKDQPAAGFLKIEEGTTNVLVPAENDVKIPTASVSVFYNPEMEMNRDINVAATSVFVGRLAERKGFEKINIRYLDAFSASGIRGLRIANEVGISVVLNDIKPEAVNLIQKNITENNLQNASAVCEDANVLLCREKFAIVDIDPFGTPSPFLDAAAMSATFLLGVTATDTAPLCGAHLKSGMRKYDAVPLNNEFHSEMGLRILLGSIARETAKFDKGIRPLLSHSTRHYVRVYAEILHGAGRADQTLQNLGFLAWCPHCNNRETKNGLAVFMSETCECGSKRKLAGPLWLGPLREEQFCSDVISMLDQMPLNKKEPAKKLVESCKNEADLPFFYDQHMFCEELKISAPPIEPFLEKLRTAGYIATRTHFSGTSFKTDAPIDEIKKKLLE
ncbi:tRNA (guanine(26)-N(2)/guanine(27)-N(2))-dimethyltransferase [Methanosarcinaceae archaeon Ag5]|uniref:tRNA (guanine(26)-N(2))-dimethyltransferase n=1 Tax=Methanolapillus africanus TaxID=3028297 RepID=A0AAE4SDM3_9EURY|nr:tRNA (guanine(26)-N(2)/guanine(27)-N(2))-dimethyltransferase [Methanosarcinaceae archaeon Ag5]